MLKSRLVLGLVASVALHGLLVVVASLLHRTGSAAALIDIEVVSLKRQTSPAVIKPRWSPRLPTPRKKAESNHRRLQSRPGRRPRTSKNRPAQRTPEPEPSPPTPRPPPSFGLSPNTAVEGASSVTVPMGDTVATTPSSTPRTSSRSDKKGDRAGRSSSWRVPRVVRKPRLKSEHKIPYPREAASLGIEGTVQLRVLVGRDGKVHKVRVLSGPGFGLNQAAQRALRRFRFYPAIQDDGLRVQHWITYRYTFQIRD